MLDSRHCGAQTGAPQRPKCDKPWQACDSDKLEIAIQENMDQGNRDQVKRIHRHTPLHANVALETNQRFMDKTTALCTYHISIPLRVK